MPVGADLIPRILYRNRNTNLIYSLLVIIAGCALILNPWKFEGLAFLLLSLLAFAVFISGILIFIRTLKNWNIERHPVMQIIHHRPGEVVWVYHQIIESMPFGVKTVSFTNIYIHMVDRSSERLGVRKEDCEAALKELRLYFRNATFGHSIQKEQLYRANPELLLKKFDVNDGE